MYATKGLIYTFGEFNVDMKQATVCTAGKMNTVTEQC